MRWAVRTGCWFLAAALGGVGVAAGNPSSKSLDEGFAVHDKTTAAQLRGEAQAICEPASRKLRAMLEAAAKDATPRISPRDVGLNFNAWTQLMRLGRRLELMGESAGWDYAQRASLGAAHVRNLIDKLSSSAVGVKYIDQVRGALAGGATARDRAVKKLEQFVQQQKWSEAEKLLYSIVDEIEPGTVFLPGIEQKAIYGPFDPAQSAIESALIQARSAQAAKDLLQAVRDLTPSYADALREITAAVDAVGNAGSAPWGGATVDGPQLATGVGQRWQELQLRALQARAKSWAYLKRGVLSGVQSPELDAALMGPASDSKTGDRFADDYAAFRDAVEVQLVRLVESDAVRNQADAAPARYAAYLQALAPLARLYRDGSLAEKLEKALERFAEATPKLAADVRDYRRASDELLRWRAAGAQSAVAAMQPQYPLIDTAIRFAATVPDAATPLFVDAAARPELVVAAPVTLEPIVPRLVGRPTLVLDLVRLAPGKAAIGRYRQRCYAMVPPTFDAAADVAALKADLLVDDQTPPRTLAAAIAVHTAERGDWTAIGGTVQGVTFESLVTRFADLPKSASVLTPLGELPDEDTSRLGLTSVVVRLDVAPEWVRHEYFFLRPKQ